MNFSAVSRELTGGFSLRAPIDAAFELFSPVGERLWVPGWNPEPIDPRGDSWIEGQIFRTIEDKGEGIWVISRLDRGAHRVEYHRVEQRYVARIRVQCQRSGDETTDVSVAYRFVGLSADGNRDIETMTEEAYEAKMTRWQNWIDGYFASLAQRLP